MSTYYVTPIGNDSNSGLKPGSMSSLQTVSEALSKALEQDTVYIRRDHQTELSPYDVKPENFSNDYLFIVFTVDSGDLTGVNNMVDVDITKLPPVPSEFYMFEKLREKRNVKLYLTDWVDANGSNLTAEQLTAAQTYRDNLRDITSTTDPWSPEWPTPPTCLNDSLKMEKILKI